MGMRDNETDTEQRDGEKINRKDKIDTHRSSWQTERDRALEGEGQRERETQNLKESPGSKLSVQSPMQGLNS